MIHILDTEHPWDVHSINSGHSEAITCLEWDQSGEAGSLGLQVPELWVLPFGLSPLVQGGHDVALSHRLPAALG